MKSPGAPVALQERGQMRHISICVVTCIVILIYSLNPCYALDVTLAWDANSETELAGYKVYYGTTAGGPYNGSGSSEGASPIVVRLDSLTTPASPQFTIHGLVDGAYYFVATAYNSDGLESGYSNEAYTQGSSTPPTTPPTNGAPTLSNLEVNGTSGSATSYTNDANRLVNIRIVASDDSLVSQYLILDGNSNANGGTFMGIPGGPRQNPIFTVSDFVLNNSDGNHTIYAWVKDDQGLASASATKTNVILDRAAPTVAISYSVSNPYNVGDVVTITANFTDSNPISGTPSISINYAGSGSDISNASMTQVSNKQWRYVITVPSGNDGTATVTIAAADAAGNPVGSLTGSTFVVDNGGPTVVGFPVINYTENSITITYSESNMQNATLASSYSLNNGLLLSGNGVDTSGTGKVFKLPLNPATLQRYLIYSLQIVSAVKDASGNAVSSSAIRINDDDNDGMADDWEKKWFGNITAKDGTVDSDGDGLLDSSEYTLARSNPAWGSNRWALSPLNQDSDSDGISDKYEVSFGLNPVSSADRDLDLDSDGWSNYEEFLYGTSANDPNSSPQAMGPIEVVEVIPLNNSGISPSKERLPNNSVFAVRMESVNGIDMTDPNAVAFSVNDGSNTYTRKLNDLNGMGSKILWAIPLDADGSVAYSLWAAYYRSNETALQNSYPYDAAVEVKVSVKDRNGEKLEPIPFHFKIQGQERDNEARIKAPKLSTRRDSASPSKKTSSVDSGELQGASITYDSNLMQEIGLEPYIGPSEEIPPMGVAEAAGVAVNLLPPAVFPNGVKVTIPCPASIDVSTLSIYYYDGEKWVLACDSAGNVLPDGEGWMVPGSRVNHNQDQNSPAYIEIQVYHFSAAAAGETISDNTTLENNPSISGSSSGSGTGSGGCFISTLWN
jgi:hypothetical protein